jgi:hypothetical protein
VRASIDAGTLRERVAGDHHVRVGGDEQVEAANVQIQASTGAVGVRAMGRIALDGEHIGLNDDPRPLPFAWSASAGDLAAPRPEPPDGPAAKGAAPAGGAWGEGARGAGWFGSHFGRTGRAHPGAAGAGPGVVGGGSF